MGMTLTGKVEPYKKGFGAMMPDVFHVPFPQDVHGITTEESMAGIDKLFKADVDPARVAAVIFEPVQGEGGFYEVRRPIWCARSASWRRAWHRDDRRRGADRLCPHRQAVRDGGPWRGRRHHHHGQGPGRRLADRSAVTGRAEIMDASQPGGLGGTYAGNPLGVAAANAVLDVIEEEDLCARANELGSRLKQKLEAIRAVTPEIIDIRGPGFMVAVEFAKPGSGEPDAGFTGRVRVEALKRGLIVLTCGVYGNVIRFLAPITIPDAHFAEAMGILEEAVAAARQG
jgi:4-aminobutyrate aminotransferase